MAKNYLYSSTMQNILILSKTFLKSHPLRESGSRFRFLLSKTGLHVNNSHWIWLPGMIPLDLKTKEISYLLHSHIVFNNFHVCVCVCVCVCVHTKLLWLCPTFCDPMGYSSPGSFVHGILQERILEWVVMLSSRGSSQPRDWTHNSYVSCIGRWILYH